MSFTFQEVLSGDEALIVLAEARCSVQQEVGALILVDPEEDLSVFKVAWVKHGLRSVGQNLAIHNGDKWKPEEGWPWQDLLRRRWQIQMYHWVDLSDCEMTRKHIADQMSQLKIKMSI